jgi:UDP-N-acetyl-D-glucosamine dehydrogenase
VKVSVVGLGFVGIPIVEACLQRGFHVVGIDIDPEKIDKSKQKFQDSKYIASDKLADVEESQIILLALPTPLLSDGSSDLSALIQVTIGIAPFLSEETLVVVESTYGPYTTRKLLVPLLSEKSGISQEDLQLAYSPERINPGDPHWNLQNTPKILSGLNQKSIEKAKEFYVNFVDNIVIVDSIEIAETAKLLENIYRFINISFINEFQKNCKMLGIDAISVINAAKTKPYGYQAFYPSVGVGGHCIPIAPKHFQNLLEKETNFYNSFIELASRINFLQPTEIILSLTEYLGEEIAGKRILIVGITYKPNVPDLRESPIITLIELLRKAGARVFWHDPLVENFGPEVSSELDTPADLLLYCVNHKGLKEKVLEISQGVKLDLTYGSHIRELIYE